MTPATFPTFFEALWGYAPFAWQNRLLAHVHTGGWPSILDLPTGAGKTATLDVALFALALDAGRPSEERRQARRIALVIDRRVVVDQAFQRAALMARKLDEAKDGVLAEVAAALRELSGNPDGLPVLPAILRGGMPRETEWAKSPSQPVILVSTVDQVGSRLLFRGYGVSDRMRPVHAGLLGRDALLLLDEVHLARPFEETLSAITERYAAGKDSTAQLPPPLAVVRMSATVAESSAEPFGLRDEDRQNARLQARLSASKLAVLRQVKTPRDSVKAGEAIAQAAVREVERLAKGPPRALAVIVNRVDTARQVARAAQQRLKDGWTVSLLTGRMRPLDRLERQTAVLDQVAAGRTRSADSARLLLVSTQAIEAGADFDFDGLVTECASLDALRQRFGRLDRMGDLASTEAVVLAGSGAVDEKADPDPIYGRALRETWTWLHTVGTMSADHDASVVDFGVDALQSRLDELNQETRSRLLAPRALAPILASTHIGRWVQTSPAPQADPDIAPFLHGIGRGAPEVQLVWRADIEAQMLTEEALSALQEMLETVRPSPLEALSLPLWTAKQWLSLVARRRATQPANDDAAPVGALSDVEGAAEELTEREGAIAPVVAWAGGTARLLANVRDLRPGAILVVPSSYGGLDAQFAGWDPESQAPVPDRGDEAQLLQRGKAVLRWGPAVIATWGSTLPDALQKGPRVSQDEISEHGSRAERRAFDAWATEVRNHAEVPAWARVTLDELTRRSQIASISAQIVAEQELDEEADKKTQVWRATWHPRRVSPRRLRALFALPELRAVAPQVATGGDAATEDDEGSFLGSPVGLSRHLEGVRDFARAFATALHLPDSLVADLALAGWIHDIGKADPRFQILLHGGDPVREAAATELLAKSPVAAVDRSARERAQQRSGYPKGMRHELLSVALVEGDTFLREQAHDWDLVLHLVAAHHGWCRPFAPPVGDPSPQNVSVKLGERSWTASSAHDLQRFDSGVPVRFWRLTERYGYWGLAWLEAVLRLADHRESEREQTEEADND